MVWSNGWNSSSSSNGWDEWQGQGQGQGNTWGSPAETQGWPSNKERDRFKNVTTLGPPGKHCLPLEDRKSLLMALLMELNPDPPVLSKIALSGFNSMITHAVLYLLTRARPTLSIRLLRDEDNVFTITDGAKQLAATVASLLNTKDLG